MQLLTKAEYDVYEYSLNAFINNKVIYDYAIETAHVEGIKKALYNGKLSFEEIAEDFDVSIDFAKKPVLNYLVLVSISLKFLMLIHSPPTKKITFLLVIS